MFTFDRKPLPSKVHSPVSKPASPRRVQAPSVNPLWIQLATSTNAGAVASPEMPPKVQEGRKWLKHNEHCTRKYYDTDSEAAKADPSKGNCTVGCGHLVRTGACREGEIGQSITPEKMEEYFNSDVVVRERKINEAGLTLSQTEFDAVLDQSFIGWYDKLVSALRAGDKKKAAELIAWPGGDRGARRKTLFTSGRFVYRGGK